MKAKTFKIYIDNNLTILNLTTAGVEKIADDEIFVELPAPYHKGFFVSQYGRAWDGRKKQGRLKPMPLKGNKDRQRYQLPDEHGKLKWYAMSRLVASIFCENDSPATKTHVHHLDKCPQNNKYDNLIWVSPGEHRLLESGKKLYTYNIKDKSLTRYNSVKNLCDDFGVKREEIYKILYRNKPIFILPNGEKVYELLCNKGKKPVYIAVGMAS